MVNPDKRLLHLSKDARLRKILIDAEPISTKKEKDLYFSLLRAIVGQQLSVKAAATIWQRFLELFPDKYPEPELIFATTDAQMRAAGLSFQKAGYIRNIAEFSKNQGLDHKKLDAMDDDALVEYLVQIKGVGRWTVDMLLMFSLGREDVFPVDDLGIQNGMMALYGLKPGNKKELYALMRKRAEKWRPYRSLACMYIWQYKDAIKK